MRPVPRYTCPIPGLGPSTGGALDYSGLGRKASPAAGTVGVKERRPVKPSPLCGGGRGGFKAVGRPSQLEKGFFRPVPDASGSRKRIVAGPVARLKSVI